MTGLAQSGPSAWLDHRPGGWLDAAIELLAVEAAVVRVTVASLRGSGPREPGASLVVSRGALRGTIGGGALEFRSIQAAQALLDDPAAAPVRTIDCRLGPDLAQCCGGRVVVWIERLTAADRPALAAARRLRDEGGQLALDTFHDDAGLRRVLVDGAAFADADATIVQDGSALRLEERWSADEPPLWLFGAGHVGQAILRLLWELPLYRVTWIDPRPQLLPATLPPHVRARCLAQPVDAIAELPAGARVLVLTHDHELDYALCRAVLERGDAQWLGLIGSASKSARFRSRLRREGFAPGVIASLTCPIGQTSIRSKLPAAIAVGVVAQLLAELGRPATEARSANATAVAVAAGDSVAAACEPGCGRCSLSPPAATSRDGVAR
jgi:xanthine dehydrogenase accessory factor